jgi:hypothetical protein
VWWRNNGRRKEVLPNRQWREAPAETPCRSQVKRLDIAEDVQQTVFLNIWHQLTREQTHHESRHRGLFALAIDLQPSGARRGSRAAHRRARRRAGAEPELPSSAVVSSPDATAIRSAVRALNTTLLHVGR